MRIASAVSLIVALTLSGCDRATPAPQLRLPSADGVDRIEATIPNTYDVESGTSRREYVTDSSQIVATLELVSSLNHDMTYPPYTFPSPINSIAFYGPDDSLLLVLFLGCNWIGGGDSDASGNRLTDISESDRTALLALLGLTDDEWPGKFECP